MRLCDVPVCVELVRSNWTEKAAANAALEMRHAFDKSMEWPPIYYVYEVDGNVVAFAGMIESWIRNGVWDFIWINIRKDYQRKGIGKALTQYRIEKVKEMGGCAIHLMTKKYRFFASQGFQVMATYGTREPWLLMVKQLGEFTEL